LTIEFQFYNIKPPDMFFPEVTIDAAAVGKLVPTASVVASIPGTVDSLPEDDLR
jgi:hypothetical protein